MRRLSPDDANLLREHLVQCLCRHNKEEGSYTGVVVLCKGQDILLGECIEPKVGLSLKRIIHTIEIIRSQNCRLFTVIAEDWLFFAQHLECRLLCLTRKQRAVRLAYRRGVRHNMVSLYDVLIHSGHDPGLCASAAAQGMADIEVDLPAFALHKQQMPVHCTASQSGKPSCLPEDHDFLRILRKDIAAIFIQTDPDSKIGISLYGDIHGGLELFHIHLFLHHDANTHNHGENGFVLI